MVGGAVRDQLLGLDPKDVDYVVVGATPAELLAQGFQQVGADFPVFLHPETGDEYALARIERKTGTGYLGFSTETAGVTIEEDLFRRDLTINAMARDSSGSIIDPYGGQDDLRDRLLRHVSPAFAEDPLRVVRLARFYARYSDFRVATLTKFLCADLVKSGAMNELSIERFWAELQKVFKEDQPARFFTFLDVIGAFKHVDFFCVLYDQENLVKYAIAVKRSGIDNPVMHHTALTAKDGAVLRTADTRTQVLHTHLKYVRKMDRSIDDLYRLLKNGKAWSVGTGAQDLCDAMTIAQTAGEKHAFSVSEITCAINASREVTAAAFNLPQGKELGAAIEQGRKEAISRALNL